MLVSVCVSWQRASDVLSSDKMSIAEINGLTTYRAHAGPAGMVVQTLDEEVCQLGQHRYFGTSYNDMATFIDELPTNTYITGFYLLQSKMMILTTAESHNQSLLTDKKKTIDIC